MTLKQIKEMKEGYAFRSLNNKITLSEVVANDITKLADGYSRLITGTGFTLCKNCDSLKLWLDKDNTCGIFGKIIGDSELQGCLK